MPRTVKKKVASKGTVNPERSERAFTFIEAARRKQILEVALRLFAEKGFHATSLAEIADAVGVSKGVISYHFDGKPELGAEVIRQRLRDYGEYVRGRIAKKQRGRDKLLEFFDACLDFSLDHVGSYLTFIDVLGSFDSLPEKQRMLAYVNSRTRTMLIEMVDQAKSEGDIHSSVPAADLADILQAAVEGIQEECAVEPGVVDLNGCKRLLRRMLKNLSEH